MRYRRTSNSISSQVHMRYREIDKIRRDNGWHKPQPLSRKGVMINEVSLSGVIYTF